MKISDKTWLTRTVLVGKWLARWHGVLEVWPIVLCIQLFISISGNSWAFTTVELSLLYVYGLVESDRKSIWLGSWSWLGHNSVSPIHEFVWSPHFYPSETGLLSVCLPHLAGSNERKHNTSNKWVDQLAKLIDRTIRNHITSLKYASNPRLQGLMIRWFEAHGSTS